MIFLWLYENMPVSVTVTLRLFPVSYHDINELCLDIANLWIENIKY